jgi:hypothetical protein
VAQSELKRRETKGYFSTSGLSFFFEKKMAVRKKPCSTPIGDCMVMNIVGVKWSQLIHILSATE